MPIAGALSASDGSRAEALTGGGRETNPQVAARAVVAFFAVMAPVPVSGVFAGAVAAGAG